MGATRQRHVIRGMPAKFGLFTSGKQQDIPETALWRAKNIVADMDGVTHKRPSLTQWGQTLKQPNLAAEDTTVTALVDFLNGAGMSSADASSGNITASVTRSYLQFNVEALLAASSTLTYFYSGTSASTKWGLRLSMQGVNLPAYTAASTDANSLIIRAIAAAGTGKEFVLWSDGLRYKLASNNQYELIEGTELLGQGQWSTIEILCDDGGDTLVYVDDTLVDTIASSLIKDVTLTSGALFEVVAAGSGAISGEQYNARVAMLMYNDVDEDAFAAQSIAAITDFVYVTSAGSTNRVLVAAAGDYIYLDRMEQSWRPLRPKQRRNVFFTTYQRTLVWSDNDGGNLASIWQWDGVDDPELLDEAPAFLFMTEHQQRLIGFTKKHPLRLVISGYGNPNRYVDLDAIQPEDDPFDLILDAAAIPIASKRADSITAIHGDHLGNCIVWTNESAYRLVGTGVFSYGLVPISQSAGCINGFSEVAAGNDILYGGSYGIHSLMATDQFGDLQVQYPSRAIQKMWQNSNTSPSTVNRHLLDRTRVAWLRTRGLLYVHLPVDSENQIMVLNVETQQWYGPWDIESLAMASVNIESPLIEVVMHGGASGKIAYTDFNNHSDYGEDAIEGRWEFANQNGRSVAPDHVGMVKTFKLLRVYFLPTGDYDVTARWYASLQESHDTETFNQNSSLRAFTLDDEMRLDMDPEGQVYSSQHLAIHEIELEVRGYSLNFDITDSNAGSDFVFLGYELEYDIDGYEVEN